MGGSAKGSAERERYSENTWNTTNQNRQEDINANRSGQRRAVFDQQGKGIIDFLSGQGQEGSKYQQGAGDAYSTLATMKGEVNPYVEESIKANNAVAESQFQNRLAQARAGGYRGGTGANLYSQGQVASDFTNQLAANNANLRYGAFNDAQNRGITANVAGAGGLAGLSSQGQAILAQIVAALRGEDVNDQTQQRTNATAVINELGGRSGTRSKTKQDVEAEYKM